MVPCVALCQTVSSLHALCSGNALQAGMAHSLAITIISLAVNPDSWVARDPTVEQLFVEYQFLNYNETELETPISLPKPRPGQSACFNFRQGISVEEDCSLPYSVEAVKVGCFLFYFLFLA